MGSDGVDVDALNDWATDPNASHVAVTPDAADLDALFAELAQNISKPGATDILIQELVNPDFAITSILPPSCGTATMTGTRKIHWSIPALGTSASESAVLEFFVRHISPVPGTKLVNQSILYSDAEGNQVTFPAPRVTVECGIVVQPEPCPEPVELTAESCSDAVQVDLGQVSLDSLGRILQMDVTIQNVCPGRRVALAAILTEVDETGQERQMGMKAMTIPAHSAPACRDVRVKGIRFVAPEDADGTPGSLCRRRSFRVRFLANYLDTDYRCREAVVTL